MGDDVIARAVGRVARAIRYRSGRLVGRAAKAADIRFRLGSAETRFRRIVRDNHWLGDESPCGPGSSLAETEALRRRLPLLLEEIAARSMLDIPCGDFHWMSRIELPLDRYIGADIVRELVARNTELFGSEQRQFRRLDIRLDELPEVDVLLSRDCLDHFALADAVQALTNLARSRPRFVLLTTYPGRRTNPDIRTGDWRPLNLALPPFSLPDPIEVIDEESDKPGFSDKSIGLWTGADVRAAMGL